MQRVSRKAPRASDVITYCTVELPTRPPRRIPICIRGTRVDFHTRCDVEPAVPLPTPAVSRAGDQKAGRASEQLTTINAADNGRRESLESGAYGLTGSYGGAYAAS